jgi:hypothetical protein
LKEVFTPVGGGPVIEIFLSVQVSYFGVEWKFRVFDWQDPGLASEVFCQISRVWVLWGITGLARLGHGLVLVLVLGIRVRFWRQGIVQLTEKWLGIRSRLLRVVFWRFEVWFSFEWPLVAKGRF